MCTTGVPTAAPCSLPCTACPALPWPCPAALPLPLPVQLPLPVLARDGFQASPRDRRDARTAFLFGFSVLAHREILATVPNYSGSTVSCCFLAWPAPPFTAKISGNRTAAIPEAQ